MRKFFYRLFDGLGIAGWAFLYLLLQAVAKSLNAPTEGVWILVIIFWIPFLIIKLVACRKSRWEKICEASGNSYKNYVYKRFRKSIARSERTSGPVAYISSDGKKLSFMTRLSAIEFLRGEGHSI